MAQPQGFQTGLEGKPWYVSAAVAVVIAVAIVAGFHFTKFESIRTQINNNVREFNRLDKKINEGRSAQKSLPQFREEVGRLELELEKLLKVLPTEKNMEGLLRRVRQLTEQGDFNVQSFAPRTRAERDFYYDWPIQVRLLGSYHNLALFFDRLSRLSRIFNVDNLRIRARGRGRHSVSATFTMKTFLYIERTEEEEDARERRQRRRRR